LLTQPKGIDISVPEEDEPDFKNYLRTPDPTFDLWNDNARFGIKYQVIPELMAECIKSTTNLIINYDNFHNYETKDETISVGISAAIMYKKFLKELEK